MLNEERATCHALKQAKSSDGFQNLSIKTASKCFSNKVQHQKPIQTNAHVLKSMAIDILTPIAKISFVRKTPTPKARQSLQPSSNLIQVGKDEAFVPTKKSSSDANYLDSDSGQNLSELKKLQKIYHQCFREIFEISNEKAGVKQ